MTTLGAGTQRVLDALCEDPYFDVGMSGFIVNTARREHWRVARQCDFEDLVLDGVCCFVKCRRRYVDPRPELTPTKDVRRWLQALVKTTFYNHVASLAAKHKGVSETTVTDVSRDGDTLWGVCDRYLPSQPPLGEFYASLAKAPEELLELMRLLAVDGATALGFVRRVVGGRGSVRETTNEYYCRLLGVDPAKRDIIRELREVF